MFGTVKTSPLTLIICAAARLPERSTTARLFTAARSTAVLLVISVFKRNCILNFFHDRVLLGPPVSSSVTSRFDFGESSAISSDLASFRACSVAARTEIAGDLNFITKIKTACVR